MKLRTTKGAAMGLSLLLMGESALAGMVFLTGAPGNSCSSYSSFSVDAKGNLTVNCSDETIPSTASIPLCTLTASPSTISLGGSSTLTANCSPAATSYIWTGPGMSGLSTTSSRGTVSPSETTAYSVTGVNNAGTGNTDSKVVTVSKSGSKPGSSAPPSGSSIDEVRRWNYAFETINHFPYHDTRQDPLAYMSYNKQMQAAKPTHYHLPTSW